MPSSDERIHALIAKRDKVREAFDRLEPYEGNEWYDKQRWQAKVSKFNGTIQRFNGMIEDILVHKHVELIVPFNIEATIANVMDEIQPSDPSGGFLTEDMNPFR